MILHADERIYHVVRYVAVGHPQTILLAVQTLVLHFHDVLCSVLCFLGIVQLCGKSLIGAEDIHVNGWINIILNIQQEHAANNHADNHTDQSQRQKCIQHIGKNAHHDLAGNSTGFCDLAAPIYVFLYFFTSPALLIFLRFGMAGSACTASAIAFGSLAGFDRIFGLNRSVAALGSGSSCMLSSRTPLSLVPGFQRTGRRWTSAGQAVAGAAPVFTDVHLCCLSFPMFQRR